MPSRRAILSTTAFAACAAALPRMLHAAATPDAVEIALAQLEQTTGGRLGVAMLDTTTGARHGHRAGERFPMCSTSKLVAVAALLHKIDRNDDQLFRRIAIHDTSRAGYAPVTSKHLGLPGLTLEELCEAAIVWSDNAAMNAILEAIDGPAGWTTFARSLGDTTSRLDRTEPALNECRPGDERDTTTPSAMLETMRRIVLGDALSAASRDKLSSWLVGCRTGDQKIRAGVPASWRVADKTGSNGRDTSNDLAVIWPTGRQPWLLTVFLTQSTLSDAQQAAVSANAARLCTTAI